MSLDTRRARRRPGSGRVQGAAAAGGRPHSPWGPGRAGGAAADGRPPAASV